MRYEAYLELLASHESRGYPHNGYDVQKGSYIGRYQIGSYGLQDSGFMDKQGNWTGKYGVYSPNDFRNNPDAQEAAIDAFNAKNWSYIQHYGFDDYIGDDIHGTEITPYGLLAGYHLLGYGNAARPGLNDFLTSNGAIDPVDGNGTPISLYMQHMGGYPDPADNFFRSPFIAFPDSFASADVNSPFAQGAMPPGWDALDPFAFGYGQLPDPNAGGPFAASQADELNGLQRQLDDLQISIQSAGPLF